MNNNEMTQCIFRLTKDFSEILKTAAWKSRKSVKQFITEAVQEKIDRENLK